MCPSSLQVDTIASVHIASMTSNYTSVQTATAGRLPFNGIGTRYYGLIIGPIVLLLVYFNWSDIQRWVKELKSSTPHSTLQVEPSQAQPVEADLPLSSKDAAIACGKVLKLGKPAFKKLDIVPRLASLVNTSGFTEEDMKEMNPAGELEDEAFSAYSLAYLTWEQPTEVSRASFDKMVVHAAHSQDLTKFSPDDRAKFDAYMVKDKSMMLKAFDLGRHDAKTSPCPF
jgi:hypothetical protein